MKRDISVEPELTPEMKTAIAKTLSEHITKVGVRITTVENEALKKEIQEHVFSGGRAQALAKKLRLSFGVDEQLASKLAFQASSIVLSKYRELRARAIGCVSYTWSTSRDARVCDRCGCLDGKVFLWENPPEGGHPGECLTCPDEAGCRCVAIPVLNFD